MRIDVLGDQVLDPLELELYTGGWELPNVATGN